MHAFDYSLWPPHVAAAWVATRDRNFVNQVFDKPMRYLAVALAVRAVDPNGLKSAGPPYQNSHDASLALRDATAEGSVQAIGDPYRWFAQQSRTPPRRVCEPTRVIDPLEIASAVCRDDHGSPDCFVPKDLHLHGSRFQNVFYRRSTVLARFPALQATRATARNEDEALKALSSFVTDLIKRTDAETWLRNRGFDLGPRAFQRVWRSARQLAGLTPAAPRGRKRQA